MESMQRGRTAMRRLFDLNNPIWIFVGRLADAALLSFLWLVCSLPVITIGASSTALDYVTLKMTEDKEGRLAAQFWRCFKKNLRQSIGIWLGFAAVGALLAFDITWALSTQGPVSMAMLITASVISCLYLCMLSFIFVLLASVENSNSALVKMTGAIVIRNLLPVIAGVIVYAAFILVGVFLCWPVLLLTPGLPALLNAKIYLFLLNKYGLRDNG